MAGIQCFEERRSRSPTAVVEPVAASGAHATCLYFLPWRAAQDVEITDAMARVVWARCVVGRELLGTLGNSEVHHHSRLELGPGGSTASTATLSSSPARPDARYVIES